jgi:hypothetical protein
VPEPRTSRDLQAVPPVQFDPTGRRAAAYTREIRKVNILDKAASTRNPRRRTRDGMPVAIRNGLPVRHYQPGRNTRARSMTAAEAARHLGVTDA